MAEETMSVFRQVVRNILAALQTSKVDDDDDELHDLALHIGHAGKL